MNKKLLQKSQSELQKGMQLAKCRKCGCMKETLEQMTNSIDKENTVDLLQDIKGWLRRMEEIKYHCLGCKHCFPATALNIFYQVFPELEKTAELRCESTVKNQEWPPVAGDYFAFCKGATCPVAVTTLASIELAETLAKQKPSGLCIVGKTETENIGIDKIIKNTLTNPTIRFLIVVGQDSDGHQSGQTLLALAKNGVDEKMRVIGSTGKRPILKNISASEVDAFRRQVKVIDMVGCEDAQIIIAKIDELSTRSASICECKEYEPKQPLLPSAVSRIKADKSLRVKMDKAGYFVIILSPEKKIITVEHYSYANKLLHIIEGAEAPVIYLTIIENGWVTELSHAAYLGRELAKAEFSIKYNVKYIQDKAGVSKTNPSN